MTISSKKYILKFDVCQSLTPKDVY